MTGFYRSRGKRIVDVVGASCALIVLSPVMGLTAAVILRRMGRPVLFTQERAGRDGQVFRIVKFRTLTDERGPDGALLPDDQRLTPLGARLRASSLDELPGLLNVVRGEMSLVGPRPLVARYLDRYTDQQARRHEVRPGLTGWVAVSGRNLLDWESKFELDVWYVDHLSLRLDMSILWRTALAVVQRRGVSSPGLATVTEFTGSAGQEPRPPSPLPERPE